MDWHQEFKEQSVFRMNENPPRIQNCLDRLTEEQVWQRPNSSSNSIGNLILHLCGNVRQYAISSLAGLPDERERNLEFSREGGMSKSDLLSLFNEAIKEASKTISSISESELMRSRTVQGFELTGVGVIIHVVEHLSYHTGQIAYWTKILTDSDLGFYDGFDLEQNS